MAQAAQYITTSVSFWSVDELVTIRFVIYGYVTKNAVQCYAIENLAKEDFTLHRPSTIRCKSMKDKFLRSVLFKFLYNSNLKGSKKMENIDDFLAF